MVNHLHKKNRDIYYSWKNLDSHHGLKITINYIIFVVYIFEFFNYFIIIPLRRFVKKVKEKKRQIQFMTFKTILRYF